MCRWEIVALLIKAAALVQAGTCTDTWSEVQSGFFKDWHGKRGDQNVRLGKWGQPLGSAVGRVRELHFDQPMTGALKGVGSTVLQAAYLTCCKLMQLVCVCFKIICASLQCYS